MLYNWLKLKSSICNMWSMVFYKLLHNFIHCLWIPKREPVCNHFTFPFHWQVSSQKISKQVSRYQPIINYIFPWISIVDVENVSNPHPLQNSLYSSRKQWMQEISYHFSMISIKLGHGLRDCLRRMTTKRQGWPICVVIITLLSFGSLDKWECRQQRRL